MGGSWMGQVAVGTEADGNLDVFAGSNGGGLEHATQTSLGSSWSAWAPLVTGTAVAGTPVVGTDADGLLEVFVVGSNYGPLEDFSERSGGSWGEASLGGSWSSAATPSVVRNLDGRLEVFLTGGSGQLYHAWQGSPGASWSVWLSLGGDWSTAAVHDGISAILNQYGEIQVFARGDDGNLYDAEQPGPGGAFTWWRSLGAPPVGVTGGPFTMIWPAGYLDPGLVVRRRMPGPPAPS